MKSALKLLSVSVCFCISSGIAAAQAAPCVGGSNAAQSSPIGCVTGEGVQVTSTIVPEKTVEAQSLTPEQRPAIPPAVIFANGKLTVNAKNSTLADILRAVATKTGAAIEIPEGAEERVVTQLGPAPARDVMAALLNGSHYNYVMVGTEADPEAIAHIILTTKSDHTDTGAAAAASGARPMSPRTALQAAVMQPYQEMLQQQQAQQALQVQQAQEQQPQASIEPATPEPQAQATGDSGAGGGVAAATTGAVAEAAPVEAPPAAETPRNGGPQGDRTPQQVLQDLYETRRQMMQQQHLPPPQQ